ncbi:MAG: PfkB family carbohydrate kinase, partial [Nitrospinota bacterium]
LILVEGRGQNQIAVVPGANSLLTPDCLHALRGKRAWGEVLLAQLEIPLPTVERALKEARASGALTLLNPAPAARLSPRLLRVVDFILPNEVEAELLTGEKIRSLREARRTCRRLLELGPRAAIITLGRRGVVYLSEEGEGSLAGHRVKAIDSTAAGDAFCGALAAALARGEGLREALAFANAAAALSVTREGAKPSIPRLSEVLSFLGREGPSRLKTY